MRGRKPGEDFRGDPDFKGKPGRDAIWLKDVNLREWLSYNQETGIFRWLKSNGRAAYVGAVAGCVHPNGYRSIMICKVPVLAHRLAWWFCYGTFPKHQIDHINGARADNRISNLREATNAQNVAYRGIDKRNTSGFIGIYWRKKIQRWRAELSINGKRIYLGVFRNKNDAIIARAVAETLCHGEFAAGKRETPRIYGISEWRIDTQNAKFLVTPILCDGSKGPGVDVTKIWVNFRSDEPVE